MTIPVRVITLDRTPERFARFKADNPHLIIERVGAVDGRLLDRARCLREGMITADNTYAPGALGCAASHIELWKACAKAETPFQIAEDDTILRADFHAVTERLMAQTPDWDLIKWCWNYDWPVQLHLSPGAPLVVLQADQTHTDIDVEAFAAARVTPHLAGLLSAAGTGCYAISPRGARRLLAACLPLTAIPAPYVPIPGQAWLNSGIDVECCRHYSSCNAFLSLPPMATARNSQELSTIRGHLAKIHDPAKANKAVV